MLLYSRECLLRLDGAFGDRVDSKPVASIRLIPDASRKPDPLFKQIWQRCSTKVPFDSSKSLKPEHEKSLAAAYSNANCQLSVATDHLNYECSQL